jgi:hypothetical protein
LAAAQYHADAGEPPDVSNRQSSIMIRSCLPRFSLRSLFVAVTVAATLMGAWLAQRERYARQSRICEELVRRLGVDGAIWTPDNGGLSLGRRDVQPTGLAFRAEPSESWTAVFYPGGLREVTELRIARIAIRNVDRQTWHQKTMREIVKLTSLRIVDIDSDVLGNDDIAPLKQLPELTELRLAVDSMTDGALLHVGQIRKLERLTINARPPGTWAPLRRVTDRGLKHLANLKALRELSLSNVAIRDDGFSALHSLRELSLFDCEISSQACQGLAGCSQLEKLDIDCRGAPSEHLAACLATLPRLRVVDIDGEISDAALQALSASRSIEQFGLYDCPRLTERALAAIAALPLTEINLTSAEVDGRLFMHLSRVDSLRRVSVDVGPISDEQLAEIAKMKRLSTISFMNAIASDQPVLSEAQAEWLKSRLPNTTVDDFARSICGLGLGPETPPDGPDVNAEVGLKP